jgi:hypothetical protein
VDPAEGVNVDVKKDGASPSNKYQVVVSGGAPAGLANVEVRRASGNQLLLQTQATYWGFSPDDDRFVISWVQTSGTLEIHHVALYDLTRTNPQGPIWTRADSTLSSRIQFSPSGRYLFYTDVLGGPQTQLTLVDTHTGTVQFSDSVQQVGGAPVAGEDSFGIISWGFGPNDTRFVYGYLSGSNNVTWNLVNLEKGPGHALVKNLSLLNETADYWQFSSCGEVIALVRQPGQSFVFVDLYNTKDGSSVGSEAQIAAPVQVLQLRTAATGHVATVTTASGSTNYPLGSITPECTTTSSPPPPPPPPSQTCCTSSGPFVDPAKGVNVDLKKDGASPSHKYEVVASGGAPAGLANIEVHRASDNQLLVQTQATQWGFSPDDDRFVTSSVQTSGSVTIHHVALYDLTRANPQGPIWTSADSTVSSRIQFSPSGRYLFYTDVLGGPQTQLTLVDTHTGTVAFSDSVLQVGGAPVAGEDSFGIINWGFGPNDTRFVYAYLSGSNNVTWNLVNLEKGPGHALVKSLSLLNETADYWKFSSCGEVIALVRQPGQQFVFVDLYNTKDGSSAGSEAQIPAPVQLLQLRTTATGHVATVTTASGSTNYPLGSITPVCSVSVTAHSPVDLLLTDEQGRRIGFDPVTGNVLNEIPGGSFTGVGTEPETIAVPFAVGTYAIEATGLASLTTAEPYRLTIATADDTGMTDQHDIAGMATHGTRQQFFFTVDDHLSITSLSPADTTPPSITANIVGAGGGTGWYTSDVALSWNIFDGETPIDVSAGCGSQSVTSETAGITFTCTATSAGGTASRSITVKVDKTPPSITSLKSPAANVNGWNNSPVTVSFQCAEALAGTDAGSLPPPIVLSANGAGQSATGICTDRAGNTASLTVQPINIDLIAPAVTPPSDQSVQQTSALGATVTYPQATIVETGSGLAASGCVPASGSVFAPGLTTVTCTATDLAGNSGAAMFAVTVNPVAMSSDGRMYGVGFIEQGSKHQHFLFRVSQLQGRDFGRLEYWVKNTRLCRPDDDYWERDFDGGRDINYGRDHGNPLHHFEATSVDIVTFSDDPSFVPGRPQPLVDTVRFSGAGRWNGRSGYTFEAVATDRGEPGRHRDTFSLVIKDPRGAVVANVSGEIESGNIQSTRLWGATPGFSLVGEPE